MIFLTGSSGFLGRELLRGLIQDTREKIALLIRDTKSEPAQLRARKLMAELFGPSAESLSSRIEVVTGDTSLPHFGLGESEFTHLASATDSIYHCAASTNLSQSLRDARNANVAGTAHTLELLNSSVRNSNPKRFFHVSTAYVAGDTENTVRAKDLSFKQGFRNGYEQSKAEAELLVRAVSNRAETCIFRPSIIVGHSETGFTPSFHTIYIPAQLLVRGALTVLPARPTIPFDVVPVNYVSEAIVRLSLLKERSSDSYHLCAGYGRESTPWEILECLIQALERYSLLGLERMHIPSFLAPELVNKISASIRHFSEAARTSVRHLERLLGRHIGAMAQALPFLPYMLKNPRFDTIETVRDLRGRHSPLFADYGDRLFRYCVESDWGKLPAPALRTV